MKIYNNIQSQNEPVCIALGSFDGIHIGHQRIIKHTCDFAKANNLKSAVFTFDNSPSAVLGKSPQRSLMSQNDKMKTLENLGIEICYSINFLTMRNISPEDFITKILVKEINAKAVFCGFNYRFGKSATGDTELLKKICSENGVKVFVAEPVCFGDSVVSSSRIRKLIENGEVLTANRLLGKPFSVEQIIVEGKHNGRTVGIPTINQNIPDGFVTPKLGVYASFVHVNGKKYKAITNVGTRPTVGGTFVNMETNILGSFSGEIYGQTVRTELLDFVRSEQKFENLHQLSQQIRKDIEYIYEHNIFQKY